MKTFKLLQKTLLVIITLASILPMANAQSRYRHIPRVKVGVTKVVEVSLPKERPVITTGTPVAIIPMEVEINEAPAVLCNELTAVASSNNEVIIGNKKPTSVIKHHPVLKQVKAESRQVFTSKIKRESNIIAVSDVKKTSGLLGYLLWFFIVLFICIALFVLAFYFFSAIFSIFPVFLTLAIIVFAIAALILIFGLTGLI